MLEETTQNPPKVTLRVKGEARWTQEVSNAGVCGSFLVVTQIVDHMQGSRQMKHPSFVFTVIGFRPRSSVRPDTRLSLVIPDHISLFHNLAKRPDLYDLLSHNLFPYIYGDHLVEVKRALLCALVGGVAKVRWASDALG